MCPLRRLFVCRVVQLCLLFCALAAGTLSATEMKENPAWADLFRQQGVTGTFVVLEVESGESTVHNPARAKQRYIPASTFKIPNSLIALEAGAVKNVDEIVPYGGGKQFLPEWERDQSMRDAIKVSAVPIYRELARRVGSEEMRKWVRKLGYGNQQIGDVVDRFWLDGPLAISAIEQTQFLARLAKGELPGKPEHLAAVKEITLQETWKDGALHAKTGWCDSTEPDIGWWVGWIEREGKPVITFALNIDIQENADGAKRVPLAKACLQQMGLLPK